MQDRVLCHQQRFGNGDHVGEPQCSSVTEDKSAENQLQAGLTGRSTAGQSQASQQVSSRQRNSKQTLLDKDVFSAFLDAALRCSMCPKPIRLAAGLKCLTGQDSYHLCDLAPTSFALDYVQRLQDQALFIPSISRLLDNFVNTAPSPGSGSDFSRSEPGSGMGGRHSPQGLQAHLWDLLRNRVRNQESARRLRPLKSSEGDRVPNYMLDFPRAFSRTWCVESRDEACRQSESAPCEATGEGGLFGLRLDLDYQADGSWKAIPVVTAKALNEADRRPSEGCRNRSDGPSMTGFCGYPVEERAGAGSPQHESRKYSKSVSPMSDVSMLLPCERPMKDGGIVGHPQAIGGSSWLTQNVIRMHPLRQQQHRHDELHEQTSARNRHSLYEGSDSEWWSDTSDASDLPLEESCGRYTKSHLDNARIFSLCSSETESVHDYLDLRYDSGEKQLIGCRPSMSTRQSREGSSGSLAEVIGNDHLLWHMWKRRASVAPRGEEDITDMKTLFATDPDMKLFNSRWDLDPSDISSSSNEDPMLQEATYNVSPRDKANSPLTPNSERRPYFATTRPPSSSGYVGRSAADPKRRSSLIKRFTWGGRQHTPQAPGLDGSKLEQRTMEVKRRKTLDDYEMMDKEASNDDSSDMLF
ncbi:hypothetical protein G647_05511 [Cladophialophora carrionii CBS 160.54]|uniref:Uncharacterized protein n=1 Tax=Cladophialophora carrionii CBS 160.54 TaxID=1279043 RepID=V9DAI2_9EURO|nr:uncharacterized protein G647_05511 [Cladophialophora carrionii CBS 160.54]ETI23706.1 hypothetical protein G647_05511 [Cladophialophora carrionii CBS 160.54]